MRFLFTDSLVGVPPEAIKYIEKKVGSYNSSPFLFEVIEAFFEWLSVQPIDNQKIILKKMLETGRLNVDIFSARV
jgi:hypothetical protein